MSWETAEKIIDEAGANRVESIKTNWKGESTINPHFETITHYAKLWNETNGSFIDRLTNSNFKFRSNNDSIFRGLANQTKVKVSYDSFRKDVFEKQRAGGDHDLTTRNIDLFYNHPARVKSETKLVIQAVRTKLNKDEDLEFEAKRRWPEATISIRDMVEGRVTKDLGDLKNRNRDCSQRQSCKQAHVRLIFNWKGEAFPCCPDIGEDLFLGDIHKTSLYNIFNGLRAKTLRSDLKDGTAFQYNPCKNCSSFETFKGYRAAWNS